MSSKKDYLITYAVGGFTGCTVLKNGYSPEEAETAAIEDLTEDGADFRIQSVQAL